LRFFQPSWWQLRGLLRRSYDFGTQLALSNSVTIYRTGTQVGDVLEITKIR